LNLAALYRFGVISFGEALLSHLPSQKGLFLPSPIEITVEEKKSFLSVV
jgi:hypothetical protein